MSNHTSALALEFAADPSITSLEKVIVLLAADWGTFDSGRMTMWISRNTHQSIIDSLADEYPDMSVNHIRYALSRFSSFSGITIRAGEPAGVWEIQRELGKRGVATAVADMPDNRGFVYLIRGGDRYKIGQTNDIDRRVKQLGQQSPYELERVHIVQTSFPQAVETVLHKQFDDHRVHGEWFEFSDREVPSVIEAMNEAIQIGGRSVKGRVR